MSIRKLFPLAGFLLVLAVGCDQKADPTTANKKAVQDSFAAMDKQDYARCRELWPAVNPPQKPIKIVGSPDMDREELISFLQTYWKAFPDTKHTIQNLVAEGDLVVAWVTCEGTQLGDFEGLPASGKHIHYAGVHLVKFANGKIQEWWVMDDNLGMMQQLGMELSAPKAPDPNRKGK
ncbi:MAG: ester cyclase [Firmicutes bacterium]|nr:ester cyclase [Bacillota bacterium]